MRPLRLISAALVLAMFALAAGTYGGLAERVPTHLTLDGRVDGWSDRELLTWFALPLLALAFAAAFGLLARFLPRMMEKHPELVNLPDKERLLRLPRARRAPVLLELARMLDLAALGVVVILGIVQFQLVRVAERLPALPAVVLAIAPMLLSIAIFLYLARVSNALDGAYREWTAAGSPPE